VALEGYYTTTDAAGLLGLRPPTVRDAVRRGRLAVERVGGRNLVRTAEIERYRAEVLGTRGWEGRKADDGADATPPATGAGGACAAAGVPGAQAGTGERVRRARVSQVGRLR
jgi:excisionase family DNA binding protein